MPGTWATYGVDANSDGAQGSLQPGRCDLRRRALPEGRGRRHEPAGRDLLLQPRAVVRRLGAAARARRWPRCPSDLVGALTGLTMGRFPVAGQTSYADAYDAAASSRRGEGERERVGRDQPDGRQPCDRRVRQGRRRRRSPSRTAASSPSAPASASGASCSCATSTATPTPTGTCGSSARSTSCRARTPRPRAPPCAPRAPIRRRARRPPRARAGRRPRRARHDAAPAPGPPRHTVRPKVLKERLFADPARVNAYHAGGRRQLAALAKAAPVVVRAVPTSDLGRYLAAPYALRRSQVALLPLKQGSRVIAGLDPRPRRHRVAALGQRGRREPGRRQAAAPGARAAPALRDPPGRRRRPAHRPDADPRRLEAARLDQRSTARKDPLLAGSAAAAAGGATHRADPADEQGARSSTACSPTPPSASTPAGARTSRPARSTAACSPRSSSSPPAASSRRSRALKCGHSLYTTSGNVSEHTTGDAVDIAAINGIPIDRPPGPRLHHRHRRAQAADAAGHDEAAPDHHADAVPRHRQHARAARPLRPHPRRLPPDCSAPTSSSAASSRRSSSPASGTA